MAETKHQPATDSSEALRRLRHDKSDERAALEARLVAEVRAAEQHMWPYALQWFDNAALLCGNHLARFRYSKTLGFTSFQYGLHDQSPHDAAVARNADNKLVRPVERVIAMFSKGRPAPKISQGSSQPDEKLAAQVASNLIDLMFEHPIRLPVLRRRMAMLMCLMGTAIVETEHGESDEPIEVPKMVRRKRARRSDLFPAGDEEEPEDEYETVPAEDGSTEVFMRPEMHARIWTPLHVGPDPAATNEDDAIWFRRSTFEDIDSIWEDYDRDEDGFYPEALGGMGASKGTESPLYYWSRINDLVDSPQQHDSGFASRFDGGTGLPANYTGKHLFDVKPSRMFPRGRTMVLAGGKLVFCSDQARAWIPPQPERGYVGRWHEYAVCRWFEMVGRWLGVPLLSLLAPLQRKINAIDACTQENRENVAIGQWLLPQSAKVAEGLLSGNPRQHVTYRDLQGYDNSPRRIQNQPLPQELLIERDQLERSIDWISSTGIVDKDIASSAARAGVILEFIRGEQLAGKEPTIQAFERTIETIGQNVLLDLQAAGVAGDPWTLERLKICAPGQSQTAVQAFLSTSLLDHHAVRIDIASEILRTPEAKQARAESAAPFLATILGQQGRINELIEALGLGDIIRSPQNTARERAEWILALILSGITDLKGLIMPGIDDMGTIFAVFLEFLQTPRYSELPAEQQRAVLAVWEMAQAELQKQVAAQQAQAMQMEAAGAKPKKPAAAAPAAA